MLDRVTHRKDLKDELVSIVRMLMHMPPPVMGDLPAPEAEETKPEPEDNPAE